MGNGLFKRLWKKHDVEILFIGFDVNGKSTAMCRLQLGEMGKVLPTMDFSAAPPLHKNNTVSITPWDYGGREKIGALYLHYWRKTKGMVYYFDSSDTDSFKDIKHEIEIYAWDDARQEIPILILANKQELPGALSVKEIRDELAPLFPERDWKVFGVKTTEDKDIESSGLKEAFDWLTDAIVAMQARGFLRKCLPEELNEVEEHDEEKKKQSDIIVETGVSVG